MKNSYSHGINIYVVTFLLLSLFISALATANSDSPEMKTKTVFGQIESALIDLKSQDTFTKNNIKGVLTQHLLPDVNTEYFSNKVLGKNLTKIPNDLRADFVTELSTQLINSYSHLLSKYNNEAIIIGTSSVSKSGNIAIVKISIVGQIKTNNAVVKLLKSDNNNWKFFDIIIEGISLLDAKQKEINSSIQRLGIEGTLSHLKATNLKSNTSSKTSVDG
jgi:ABC-type transporter MlaC component